MPLETPRAIRIASVAVTCAFLALPALAETAWVKGEVQVNLRSGAGRDFRIKAALSTGDRVEIVGRGEGWTQVETASGVPGWIPAGYLTTTAPAIVALKQVEAERDQLAERVAELTQTTAALQVDTESRAQRDAERDAEVERLTHENIRLRASTRWPEWLTGAGVVLFGMLVGAIVAGRSGRQQPRIKL